MINNGQGRIKTVYVAMEADLLHPGHLNIINEARKLGQVIVGLFTDKAIATYEKLPALNYEQRKIIMENVRGVKEVVPQDSMDYTENLKRFRPDYVVHGDDWKMNIYKEIRKKVIETLKEWGGKLIEPAYTEGIDSARVRRLQEIGTTPEIRMRRFKRLLQAKPLIRILEAHNGLTALIAENTSILKDGIKKEFDGVWISSLTDSVAKGKPDIGFIDLTSRLNTINQVLESTTKPVILDGDNGGEPEHFALTIRTLERSGISAIIIEDKVGAKKNSLLGAGVGQIQDRAEDFSYKISLGKKAQITDDFMIIARIESLILNKGMDDALERAEAYIKAGADAIMIHSKNKEPDEVLEFCERYSKFENKVPLVAVPSTYSLVSERELKRAGVNIVIYANQMLRSSYLAMKKTAELILACDRAYEVEDKCMPIKDILELIPGSK